MAQVIASLMATIGADTRGFEAGSKKVKGGMSDIARTLGSAIPASVMQFATFAGAVGLVGTAMKVSLNETVKYANEVRQLSTLSGATAEDTSRLIQVLDDYKITADDAMLATRALTAKGYTPSIETLATLSDKYLSLNSAQEKNKFVLENLGKNGLKWVEVLGKGSRAIREQGAAVNNNLILNDKALKQSREYELALDNLNDSVYAMKVAVGQALIPTLIDLSNQMTTNIQDYQDFKEANGDFAEFMNYPISTTFKWMTGMDDAADSSTNLSSAVSNSTQPIQDNTDAIKASQDELKNYEDALDAASQANLDFESMSRDIANSQKDYAESHAELSAAFMEAWGKGDNEGMAQAQADIDELQATWHEAVNNMIYDMVLVGVSAGGLLDSEQRALDEYAVKAGIKTQADIDEANRRRDIADSTIAGILQSEDVLAEQRKVDAETLRLQEQITAAQVVGSAGQEAAAMSNVTLSIDSATRSLMAMGEAAARTAAITAGIKIGGTGSSKLPKPKIAAGHTPGMGMEDNRDSGGPGFAGTPYMIGTGAQPEIFVPDTNGTFIPNADKKLGGGSVYNIVVNNPKKETAENSIRSALKNLSYMGVAA